MSNHDRAIRARSVLADYAGPPEDPESNINDLMTDLRHWCHASELDFEEALRVSQYHFDAEILEEEINSET